MSILYRVSKIREIYQYEGGKYLIKFLLKRVSSKGVLRKLRSAYVINRDFGLKILFIEVTKYFLGKNIKYIDGIIHDHNNFRIEKYEPVDSSNWLIISAFCPISRLSELQKFQIKTYKNVGYKIILVVNTEIFHTYTKIADENIAEIVIQRENVGYDFGGWKLATAVIGNLNNAKTITFTNDSILPYSEDYLKILQKKCEVNTSDVIFLTENNEHEFHRQSYFYVLGAGANKNKGLRVLEDLKLYRSKDKVIRNCELKLSKMFELAGLTTSCLYQIGLSKENPTINSWSKLIDAEFPFIKLQLYTLNSDIYNEVSDKNILSISNQMIKQHLDFRVSDVESSGIVSVNRPESKALNLNGRLGENGALQALNFHEDVFPSVVLPLKLLPDTLRQGSNLKAIIHCFYIDIAEQIIYRLNKNVYKLNLRNFLFILTTDSIDKKNKLNEYCCALGINFKIEIYENRGRDVAPFLMACKKYTEAGDLILHLHTKKSPHDSALSSWDNFLFENLIGDESVFKSILLMMQNPEIGIVYSGHLLPIAQRMNWGYDFNHAKSLLAKLGITISSDLTLEFPTSTMFWVKQEAIEPLIRLGLTSGDFEPEHGQQDGTLAHAIERSILYIVESQDYSYIKVCNKEGVSLCAGKFLYLGVDNYTNFIQKGIPRLTASSSSLSNFYRNQAEIYPVSISSSKSDRQRFNIVIPTLEPEQIYGGISSALQVARQIVENLSDDYVIRVIVTSDVVSNQGMSECCSRLNCDFAITAPNADNDHNTIVPLLFNKHTPISLSSNEIFFSTAWWTADLSHRLIEHQKTIYKKSYPDIYLIQDFEPNFYAWSARYAMAESTYKNKNKTIALINSEELSNYFYNKYEFLKTYCLPYEINKNLKNSGNIAKETKENIVLIYGRPAVQRNLFDLIVEGVRLWQGSNPIDSLSYKFIFAGEDFDSSLISELDNAICLGKMTLEGYCQHLKKASIGISLMLSPHPSYPPLEMASNGCITITNNYNSKQMELRSPNIISMDSVTPSALCECIQKAHEIVLANLVDYSGKIEQPNINTSIVDYKMICEELRFTNLI